MTRHLSHIGFTLARTFIAPRSRSYLYLRRPDDPRRRVAGTQKDGLAADRGG
jgi:hypothetical protein